MMNLPLKNTIIGTILTLCLPCFVWANDINTKALELAGQKNFDQALALLAQQGPSLRAGYEHRFLKSRILSWAGKYPSAQTELNALNSEFPNNPDVELALGNLAYYQSDLATAGRYYQKVLNGFPDYQDARTGLENIRRARTANTVPRKRWRIDGSSGLSTLSADGFDNWNNQFLRAEYTPETLSYFGSIQRFDRFGFSDIELQAGLSDAVRGGWDWGVVGSITPGSNFRPDFGIGGRLGRAISLEGGGVIYPNLDYKFDDYAAGGIHTIQPGLTGYLKNGVVLTGRLIGTVQTDEDDQIGWLVQGRFPATDKLNLNLGYASAPEAIDGFAVLTQSLFGGLTYAVQDDLDLHINLARDDREDSYVRNSVNVGFTHKR